jgi:phosphoglycerate-specific signal transduction histidine kinase
MSKTVKHHRISNKLIISIILFSSLITLFITLAQLYFEYKEDINYLNKNISNIETGYREGITNALWLDDKQQVIAILNGVNALPDIEYIEVQVNSELYAASGNHINDNVINDYMYMLFNVYSIFGRHNRYSPDI